MSRLNIACSMIFCVLLSGCGGYITKYGDKFEGLGGYKVQAAASGSDKVAGEWGGRFVKNVSSTFTPNDYVSVHLKSGYIYSFTEGYLKVKANQLASLVGRESPVRGQIAIVVNVIEKVASEKSSTDGVGRVVYYSDDVYERQTLNDAFAPIYGPVRWGGNPLMVEVSIMELDQEDNEQLKQILDVVARVGTNIESLGSSRLIDGLNKVGAALIASNGDDVMGRYRATFVPANATSDYALPVLRHGDVIFTRQGDRTKPIDWSRYCYNEKEGLVQKLKKDMASNEICNDLVDSPPEFTYLVMTIGKNLGTVDMTPDLNFEQLQAQVKDSGSVRAIKESVKVFSGAVAREMTFRRVAKSMNELSEPNVASVLKELEARVIAEALQCSYVSSFNKTLDDSQKKALQSLCGPDYASSSLTEGEFGYFIKRLVVMGNCLTPDEVTDEFLVDDLTEVGLKRARKNLSDKIGVCKV